MGFVLLIIGLLMVITGARGTYAQFGSQVASEFQGQNSFTYQMIALGSIGALGYIPALQTISRWALALILLVVLLGNKGGNGFFTQFQAALQQGPKAPQTPQAGTSNTALSPQALGTGSDTGTGPFGYKSGTISDFLGLPSWLGGTK
jgi:hypothetical protein